ncbi:hypothetical protein CVT25_002177 [Psilocybe cyanescens]|uniref:FHA domain-containing protein n=1 Tax=Psilocybe cyanescens TaxID=93625 RepID=A0A409X033_PSICY|nr:hypothetical protein CVT25_002177 [Psilocybe cyanescens]
MPSPAPFAQPLQQQSNSPPSNALFPALYLYPLNDTWAPKHIALTNLHTKIGRQTSSKTAPGERNGFFDSKVLSRQHAEVWEEGGKIYIKDVKSSNGTFINGERLSSEGHESDPFELKSDDIVEFGIDIVGEDNKTIIHHKVAARVVCVFTEQDAQVAARAEQHQQQQQQQQQHFMQQQQQMHGGGGVGGAGGGLHGQQHPGIAGLGGVGGMGVGGHPQGVVGGLGGLNGVGGVNGLGGGGAGVNGAQQQQQQSQGQQNFPFSTAAHSQSQAQSQAQNQQRRPQLAQGLGSMGGIGLRPPGKTGLTFDVILSRLQGEVQKSRETGAELGGLMGAMGEVGDVLVGGPANLPSFPAYLPPVRAPPPDVAQPPPPSQPAAAAAPSATGGSPTAPVAVPASISAEAGGKEKEKEGVETSASSSSSPPPATTSSGAEGEQSSSASSSATPATASTSSITASDTNAAALPAGIVQDLQSQLRDTQARLAGYLERVRQLEGVLQEQEATRREVGVLREMIMRGAGAGAGHEREQEPRQHEHEHEHEDRDGEDNEEHDSDEQDSEEDDDDDDARSISTVVAHELESVEEEDEEALARAERGEDAHGQHVEGAQVERGAPAEVEVHGSVEEAQHEEEEGVGHEKPEAESESETPGTEEDADAEAEERRREDLGVGRPRTPEPSMLGMGDRARRSSVNAEAEERRREDLGVGRPRTPEPSMLGMGDRARRSSVSSPLARRRVESHEGEDGESESESDVEAEHHEQHHGDSDREGAVRERSSDGDVLKLEVTKLALQVSSAVALTAALEQQHALAQGTIRGLERKVEELEGLLRGAAAAAVPTSSAADVSATKTETEAEAEATPEHDDDDALTHTLAEKMQLWKKAVEGQWSAVREEWADERARLDRAREEWEARARLVEFGLERMRAAQAATAGAGVGGGEEEEGSKSHGRGGLVTPPSPRSQSSGSDSGRYKRRKKRAAVAAAAAAGSGSGSASEGDGEVSEGEEEEAAKEKAVLITGKVLDPERSLATPEPSVVFKLSESVTSSLDDGESAKERHHHPLSVDSSGLDLDGDSVSGHHADEDEDYEQGDEESRASVFYSTFAKDALLIMFWVFVSFWVWVWSGLVFAWTVVLPSWDSSISSSWASSLPTAWVSSVRGHVDLSMSSSAILDWVVQALNGKLSSLSSSHGKDRDGNNSINMQTAVGVVLLSVAAAAVFWKIKPE